MARVIAVLGWFVFAASSSAAAPLVEHGRPLAVVAIASEADEHEELAARELIDHVEGMSGAKLELTRIDIAAAAKFVQQTRCNKQTPVVIGRLAQTRLASALRNKSGVGGTFALQVADGAAPDSSAARTFAALADCSDSKETGLIASATSCQSELLHTRAVCGCSSHR